MRHRVQGRKLGLPSDQRMHLLRGLVRQLIAHNSIVTTETRAKEVRRIVERLVTLGKVDSLANRRLSEKYLSTQTPVKAVRKPVKTGVATSDFVHRLFTEISPRFQDRPGGYTRMYKIGFRRGDAAPLVKLEFALDD